MYGGWFQVNCVVNVLIHLSFEKKKKKKTREGVFCNKSEIIFSISSETYFVVTH